MDKAETADGSNTNGGKKEGEEEDECLFDSDSSLPEIPDAPSTPVEERKFSAEQIFKNNLVLLCVYISVCMCMYVCVCIHVCMTTYVYAHICVYVCVSGYVLNFCL